MSIIKDVYNGITGKTAADAAKKASGISADAQQKGLDYLMKANESPLAAQQQGLSGLMDFYGGNQQNVVNQAMQSPFYNSMIGQGEEAVLRNAAVTGGLRSGGTQQGLAQNSQNILQMLVNQQLGGLQGLAGVQTNNNAISQGYGNIGNTQAQGVTAAANAKQQGLGNIINLAAMAAGGGSGGGMFGGQGGSGMFGGGGNAISTDSFINSQNLQGSGFTGFGV